MNTTTPVSHHEVLNALKEVIDPELNCNLVDLGLIYDVRIAQEEVTIKMTLTTPGCPMHDSLLSGVRAAVLNLPGVQEVDVDLVWDPPWTPDRLTPEGRAYLGLPDQTP